MRKLVIIPTYNEIENMKMLLPVLMKLKQSFDVLVVDDSSPDGPAKFVEEFAKTEPRVHVLVRGAKQGLGKAYLAGFDCSFIHNVPH